MTRYLAFDIETTKPFPEDHNWRSVRPMGIACAAACGTGDQKAQSLVQPLSKRRDRTRPDPAPGPIPGKPAHRINRPEKDTGPIHPPDLERPGFRPRHPRRGIRHDRPMPPDSPGPRRYDVPLLRHPGLPAQPKLKPRWDVHLSCDDDQLGYAGESLSSVLGE